MIPHKKCLILLSVLVLLSVSVMGIALRLEAPGAASVLSGTSVVFRAEVNITPGESNGTFFLNVSDAIIGTTLCGNLTTDAQESNNSVFNMTCIGDTTRLAENMTFRINFTLRNDTILSNISNTTSANYSINNSLPSTNSTAVMVGNQLVRGGGRINFSVGDEVTTCTFFVGSRSFVGTKAGSSCTFAVSSNNPVDGTYTVRLNANDGFGSTDSFLTLGFNIVGGPAVVLASQGGSGGGAAVASNSGFSLTNFGDGVSQATGLSTNVLMILAIVGIVWFFFKKK